MKKLSLIGVIVSVTLCNGEFKYPPVEELKYSEINWEPMEAERCSLDNGIIVYILEDHELPLINLTLLIKAGSIYDPEDKIGLAEITGNTLREGGTKGLTPEEIDSILEHTGSEIEVWVSGEEVGVTVFSLVENFDTVLWILGRLLSEPQFREDKFSKEVEILKESIRRRDDSPIQVGVLNFIKKLLKNHPKGRFPTLETVERITREDVVNFYHQFYAPNNAMIGVVGDFDKTEMIEKLRKTFKTWKKKEIKFPRIPEVEEEYERKVYVVPKEVKQSTILMGHISPIKLGEEDSYPLIIGNRILGVGFNSRLFKEIRTKKGLAYIVQSIVVLGANYRGVFIILCQTKGENTVKTIKAILKEVEKMRNKEVEDKEFEVVKEGIKNEFVFRLDTPLKVVTRQLNIEYYGLPKDYLKNYLKNIEKVNKKKLVETLEKRWTPSGMDILVVGDTSSFDASLSELGKVEEIKLE